MGVAALAVLAVTAPASAGSTWPPPPDAFRFTDCPALPAGLDPTAWRCEVHLAAGEVTIGRESVGVQLRLTHAEGPLPDGTSGQIFGVLQSQPVPVPHTPFTLQLRYAGYADLIGNGPDPGGLYVDAAVAGPGLSRDCAIGSLADPIRLHAGRVGSTETIPTDPPIRVFTLQDSTFPVPASSGCGPRDRNVDELLGLPSASGNELTLRTAYTYRTYDVLQ
jgi:hypothetical protein